jgi:hypothetical protein
MKLRTFIYQRENLDGVGGEGIPFLTLFCYHIYYFGINGVKKFRGADVSFSDKRRSRELLGGSEFWKIEPVKCHFLRFEARFCAWSL